LTKITSSQSAENIQRTSEVLSNSWDGIRRCSSGRSSRDIERVSSPEAQYTDAGIRG